MQTTAGAPLSATHRTARTRRRTAALLAIAAVILLLDQLTKIWAVAALDDGRVVDVIGELLRFRLVRNPGAAFSMFTDMTIVLTVIAAVVVVAILWVSRKVTSMPWAMALGGLLGGALGTLTDRVFREPGPMQGHVVDFIELPNWPVFNIADSSIVCSAALIALLSFRGVAFSSIGRRDDGAGEPREDGAGEPPGHRVADPGDGGVEEAPPNGEPETGSGTETR